MPMKPAKMIHLLKKNEFHEIEKTGGHRRFKDDHGHITEVPMHGKNKELLPATQASILKQAGLK